jgi:hypothetical protein
MRKKLAVVLFSSIMLFSLSSPVFAHQGENLSIKPFHLKLGYEQKSKESLRIDWGVDYSFPFGVGEVSGVGVWPNEEGQLRLGLFNGLSTAWDWEVWGIFKQDGRYIQKDYGFRSGWEQGAWCHRVRWTSLDRDRARMIGDYIYDGWEAQWMSRWNWVSGRSWEVGLAHRLKEYPLKTNSSEKNSAYAGFKWRSSPHWLDLKWEEWTVDYPDRSYSNEITEKWTVQYRYRTRDRRQWKLSARLKKTDQGDGSTEDYGRYTIEYDFPLGVGQLNSGCFWQQRCETSWWDKDSALLEDIGENIPDEAGWGVDFGWKHPFGHRRSWRLGGRMQITPDGDRLWGLETRWEWPIGDWKVQSYWFYRVNKSGDNAGTWLKMAYYFS